MKPIRLAIVGATGLVGLEAIQILEEQQATLPIENLVLLASESKNRSIVFQGKTIPVQSLAAFSDFDSIDYAIFSAGSEVSKQYAPLFAQHDIWTIDNSKAFRQEQHVPLVVPELNFDTIGEQDYLIANPNCSTIQMVVPLFVVHQLVGLKKVVANTYQAVAGAGKAALEELRSTRNDEAVKKATHFPVPIANNVIPQIDVFQENGYCFEEEKMRMETQKILQMNCPVTATTVRVPITRSHSVSVYLETEKAIDLSSLTKNLQAFPGVEVFSDLGEFPHPLMATGFNNIYVGRLRYAVDDRSLWMWVVSDNLRKGAAWNAIQIVEKLWKSGR